MRGWGVEWPQGAQRKALIRTGLAFLAVQFFYWAIISPFLFASPPPIPNGIELSAPSGSL